MLLWRDLALMNRKEPRARSSRHGHSRRCHKQSEGGQKFVEKEERDNHLVGFFCCSFSAVVLQKNSGNVGTQHHLLPNTHPPHNCVFSSMSLDRILVLSLCAFCSASPTGQPSKVNNLDGSRRGPDNGKPSHSLWALLLFLFVMPCLFVVGMRYCFKYTTPPPPV